MSVDLLFLLYHVNATINATINLPCESSNVTWVYYPHIPIFEQILYRNHSKVGSYIDDERYVVTNKSLTIRNVHAINKGHYICLVDSNVTLFFNVTLLDYDTDDDNEYRMRFGRMMYPLRIVSRKLSLSEGDTMNMTCSKPKVLNYLHLRYYQVAEPYDNIKKLLLYTESSNGYYFADIDKISFDQTDWNYEIKIKNINSCDAGIYECSVLSDDGNSSSIIYTLTVIPKYKNWWKKQISDSPTPSYIIY